MRLTMAESEQIPQHEFNADEEGQLRQMRRDTQKSLDEFKTLMAPRPIDTPSPFQSYGEYRGLNRARRFIAQQDAEEASREAREQKRQETKPDWYNPKPAKALPPRQIAPSDGDRS